SLLGRCGPAAHKETLRRSDAGWPSHTNICQCGTVLAGAYQLYERNGECGLAVNAPATVEEAFTAFEHIIRHRRHAWAVWRRAHDGPARPGGLVRAAAIFFPADRIKISIQPPPRFAPPPPAR